MPNFLKLQIALAIVFLCHQKVWSQDSLYIKSFTDKIILKVHFESRNRQFVSKAEGQSFNFRANSDQRLTLSLDYEFIGASMGFAPSFLTANDDKDLKGKTELSDMALRFFFGNWVQELHYEKLEGFYLKNTGALIPEWREGRDAFLQFRELEVTEYGGATAYVVNPDFSLRSLLYNTEWQAKSAGSFIPAVTYSYAELEAPINGGRLFENDLDINFTPGYAYSWVLSKHWSVTSMVNPFAGVRFEEDGNTLTGREERNTFLSLGIDGRMQIGYNSDFMTAGVNLVSNNFWTGNDESALRDNYVFFDLYFGVRLNPPKAIKQASNWINDQMGL